MIGFIVNEQTAADAIAAIAQAAAENGKPFYWSCGKYAIHTGDHAGMFFLPVGDDILSTPLGNGLTPQDFPQFSSIVESLGGLDARVELDPETLKDPDAETQT